jgi:hypothetical protein
MAVSASFIHSDARFRQRRGHAQSQRHCQLVLSQVKLHVDSALPRDRCYRVLRKCCSRPRNDNEPARQKLSPAALGWPRDMGSGRPWPLWSKQTGPCFIVRRAQTQQDDAYTTGRRLEDVVLAHEKVRKNVMHRTRIYAREFLLGSPTEHHLKTDYPAQRGQYFRYCRVARL